MSGIEVAGLILGAVPLIISALEHYKKTRETWRNFRQKSLYIDQLTEALEEQKVLIETDLRLILRAAGFEEADKSSMRAHAYLDLLQRPDVIFEIALYLGDIYEPYRKALYRCQSRLVEISKNLEGLVIGPRRLKIDPNYLEELSQANANGNGKFEWVKKVKFALGKDELVQRIRDLEKSTEMLSRLRVASASMNEASIQSTSRTVERFALFLQKARSHAISLYSAISTGWMTGCHPEHKMGLFLESRSAPLHKKRNPIKFHVALESVSQSVTGQCYWEEAEVSLTENASDDTLVLKPSPATRYRNVTFSLPTPMSPILLNIQDICSFVIQARQTSQALKLCLSEQGFLTGCHLPPGENPSQLFARDASSFVTLDKVLAILKLDQRMTLAFILASSLLQLYATPWLAMFWTKEVICFRLTTLSGSSGFDADHPFVKYAFPSSSIPPPVSALNAKRPLLELGIVLLEIWHKVTFNAYAAEEDLRIDDSYGRRYEVARQWLDDTQQDILPFYLDAVTRCIECSFSTTSTFANWDDLNFRKSFCEGVAKPLWENCAISRAR